MSSKCAGFIHVLCMQGTNNRKTVRVQPIMTIANTIWHSFSFSFPFLCVFFSHCSYFVDCAVSRPHRRHTHHIIDHGMAYRQISTGHHAHIYRYRIDGTAKRKGERAYVFLCTMDDRCTCTDILYIYMRSLFFFIIETGKRAEVKCERDGTAHKWVFLTKFMP